MSVFDELRSSIEDLLNGTSGVNRTEQIRLMKQGLVHARLAVDDLRAGASQTRVRLEAEKRELETVQRRRTLAEGISDAETVAIAQRFEAQHAERVRVLETKLSAQQAEVDLAERELSEMTAQLKAAAAGVGTAPGTVPNPATAEVDAALGNDAPLRGEIDALRRQAERAAKDQAAEDRLAELKRKMGR